MLLRLYRMTSWRSRRRTDAYFLRPPAHVTPMESRRTMQTSLATCSKACHGIKPFDLGSSQRKLSFLMKRPFSNSRCNTQLEMHAVRLAVVNKLRNTDLDQHCIMQWLLFVEGCPDLSRTDQVQTGTTWQLTTADPDLDGNLSIRDYKPSKPATGGIYVPVVSSFPSQRS